MLKPAPYLLFLGLCFFGSQAWSLCLQNFNIYGPAYAPQVSARASKTANQLLQDPCDILFFQEAWTSRSAKPLIKKLSAQYPSVSRQHEKHRVGLLQFSKFQVQSENLYRFRINSEGGILDGIRKISRVHKAFLVQKIQYQDDQIFILNAHLHQSSAAIRLTQILDLLSWRFENLEHDWILAGDFNANPESLEIQFLKMVLKVRDLGQESFAGKYPEDFCTYCADNPIGWLGEDQIFDYFFVGENKKANYQWVPTSFQKNLDQIGREVLSDHAGIRTQIEKDPRLQSRAADRAEVFALLFSAQKVLQKERKKEFKEYVLFLQRLQLQIEQGSGPFFDYLDPK